MKKFYAFISGYLSFILIGSSVLLDDRFVLTLGPVGRRGGVRVGLVTEKSRLGYSIATVLRRVSVVVPVFL